jgi:hypothetical protein
MPMGGILRSVFTAAPVGFKGLAPIDNLLQRHRVVVITVTIVMVLAGTPLLLHLPFDFNPVNLQNPGSPSVVAYRELQSSPGASTNDAEVIAPSLDRAKQRWKSIGGQTGRRFPRCRRDLIEAPLQSGVVKIVRQWPTDPGFARPAQARSGGGRADPETGGNLALGQAGGRQPHDVPDLAHG